MISDSLTKRQVQLAQLLEIHPTHPQVRMIRMVADAIHKGAVIVYPTDTAYALACHLGDKTALDRIIGIRQLSKHHQFTIACCDLKSIGAYTRIDNVGYRLIKRTTPGPFTFVLRATRNVPKRLLHTKRKTIAMRVPDNPIALALLAQVGEPLLTTSVRLPGEDKPLPSAYKINERLGKQVDVIIDGGTEYSDVSTVVDLTQNVPTVIRQGLGDLG